MKDLINRLDDEWDQDDGFLGRLRAGVFDRAGYERFLGLLRSIETNGDTFDRRLIEALWFVPLFMEWQTERLEKTSGMTRVEYGNYKDEVVNAFYKVLGLP
jgi:hypothetical protein